MTPRLALRSPDVASSRVDGHDPARCRWFAVGLFAAGVGAGAALLASGQPVPSPGGVLLLAVLFAVAVNRVALFPSELAVTAEAAVLLAAVVAFRDDGPFVGPWCIALLAGPFDFVHWRQRSFVRMAYNAGNRIAATLAAAALFATVLHAIGASPGALAVAALVASVTFALVECVVGTVLVWLRDAGAGSWRAAARVELPMERLTVPLGLIGACAGYLAVAVGWWCVVPVLAPTLFLPELAIVRARRVGFARGAARPLAVIGPAAVVLTALALLAPLPPAPTLLALAASAVLLGLDLRVARSVPLVVATLVGAAVMVGGGAGYAAATVAAVGAVAVACACARASPWWLPLVAGCCALAASAVYDARPSRAGALAAAVAFELLVVAGSAGAARLRDVAWTAPLVCAAVSLGAAWRGVGPLGAVAFAIGLASILVLTALFGAPPWPSRVVGPRVAQCRARAQPAILVVAAILSLCLGIAACAAQSERLVLVAAAASVAAAVASSAMTAVRQWRFAPRTRARDAMLVLASTLSVALAYPAIALGGDAWSLVLLAASLVVSTKVGWPLARLSAAAHAEQPSRTRRGGSLAGDEGRRA